MKNVYGIVLLFISIHLSAQQQHKKDTTIINSLNTVVISANKFPEKQKNVVQKIDVISQKELQQMNAQNTADALSNTGNVFVQKSQQGGGSPVLRGFEASRIQLNIDGIRYNNAIFRSGHLQSSIAVDNNALQQIEVLNGPASTIHGSDALGGIISLKTKDPKFGQTHYVTITGANAMVRFSSANNEKTGNVGFMIGNKKMASYTNLTYSSFGDLMQGKNGVDSIMNLWKKYFIVSTVNGMDTMLQNQNPYKQVATAYNQLDVLQKFSIKQGSNKLHQLNFQLSTSSNIPRYDRLTETNNGIAKNAEWYYGPQTRTLAAYKLDVVKMKGFFKELTTTLSHQYWNESRHNRGFKKTLLNHRDEKIHIMGYNIALRHKNKSHELTIGSDGQINRLQSKAHTEDIQTGILTTIDARYPDGKNNMNLIGIFAQHIWKLKEGKLVINDGLRFNYSSLHSTINNSAIMFKLPYNDIRQKNKAITGNIGVAYMPVKELRMTINFSTGFRSPNFDDMTKVFESQTGVRLVVPNVNIKPEITHNVDIGLQHTGSTFDISVYGFYTLFNNAMVMDKFTYNGTDSVLYDGNITAVYAMQNKAKAFVYGGGLQANYHPSKAFNIFGNVNYTFGRYHNDTMQIPLDHIPPLTGRIGMKYTEEKWYGELYSLFNGKKSLHNYNPNGEDNIQYSTPNGTPAWFTVNCRFGFEIAKYTLLQVGIENILDKNYRYFASGMSAAGRNFVVALRLNY